MLLRTLGTGGLEEVAGGTDKHSIRRLNKPSKVAPGDEDNKAMTVCDGHHKVGGAPPLHRGARQV